MCKKMLTVILICYNHEKYVGSSIESVLNQTYKDFYFIVVDNASTDHSIAVIKKYENQIDEIIYRDKNDVKFVWKSVIYKITTPYIAIMTSDDIWKPEKLEEQMNFLIEHPDYGACFTLADCIGDDFTVNSNASKIFQCDNRNRYEWIKKFVLDGNSLAYPSVVILTKAWKEMHDYGEPYWQLGDFIIWTKLVQKYEIYIIQKPLLLFRYNGNNLSAQNENTMVRTINESITLTTKMYKNLSGNDFYHAFYDEIKDKDLDTDNEVQVLCEKILVLFELCQISFIPRLIACSFFYENYGVNGVEDMFEKKYDMSFATLSEFCKEFGVGHLYLLKMRIENKLKEQQIAYSSGILSISKSMFSKIDSEFQETLGLLITYMGQEIYMKENEVLNFINYLHEIDKILKKYGFILNIDDGRLEDFFQKEDMQNLLLEMNRIKDMLTDIYNIKRISTLIQE